MARMSKDLQQKSKAYKAELYRKLFAEQPDVKRFVYVRKVLLWTLRGIYLLNFFLVMLSMGSMNDFSQVRAETIRLLMGLFFLWIAGRTYQGALCLWLLVLGNLLQAGQYISLFSQVTDPAYMALYPMTTVMYFVQVLYLVVLIPTAIYLSLPSSHRRQEETMKVEKAYVDMIVAEMPEIH